MKLSKQQLHSYHPMNNHVVLKPEVNPEKIQYGSVEFFMPLSLADGTPYDRKKSQPIVCSVVSAPRRLIYGTRKVFWETIEELDIPPEQKMHMHKVRLEQKYSEITEIDVPIPGSMRWKTELQVKSGDIVWVNSNALINAEQNRMTLDCEKQLYYVIKYEDLYLKKKDDDVQMLNGWVLAELIQDIDAWMKQAENIGLYIPDIMKQIDLNDRLGTIRYVGDPVEYMFNDRYDYPEIKVDDVVVFRWKVNRRLEPGMKYFTKDQDLIVTRRANIIGIME